jgi:outer membrane receptor protein involved in Fe transport
MTGRLSVRTACTSLVAIAVAGAASPTFAADKGKPLTAWEASLTTSENDMVTTGVARGRDRLDSATSTSSIKENEITRIAPRSLAELFRNLPGIRVEAGVGEGANNYTVRGLPMVGTGAKYLQFQEDGLPVLEFGNLGSIGSDSFIRADLNVASVESIRGGSASTFASNAPGGVINLVSKTGDVDGGSVQATGGLDHEMYRLDFDYGGKLSETWRFHIGGFYRAIPPIAAAR